MNIHKYISGGPLFCWHLLLFVSCNLNNNVVNIQLMLIWTAKETRII